MHQWLTASNNGYWSIHIYDKFHHGFNIHKRVFIGIPTVFYITPNTTNIASTKADKIRSMTSVTSLTLQGIKMLHQGKRTCTHSLHGLIFCFTSLKGIHHQRCNGHGTNSTRNWCNEAAFRSNRIKIHITLY